MSVFHVKLHTMNPYRTSREANAAIPVLRLKMFKEECVVPSIKHVCSTSR